MSYQQLSPNERKQVYALKYEDYLSVRAIGRLLKRVASTISREICRNVCDYRYLSDTAEQMKIARRKVSKEPFPKVSFEILESIKLALREYHSPEQIAGRLKLEKRESVSHETT
jgi:transposase, IS30 family